MIEEINKSLFYLKNKRQEDIFKRMESNILTRYKASLEWKNLTCEEKQKERKSILKAVKRYYEEDGLKEYIYQNAYIEYYDNCINVLEEIKNICTENIHLNRLKILVNVDIEAMDQDVLIGKKQLVPSTIYESIFIELNKDNIHLNEQKSFLENSKIVAPTPTVP